VDLLAAFFLAAGFNLRTMLFAQTVLNLIAASLKKFFI
jgi:hypothetical protein